MLASRIINESIDPITATIEVIMTLHYTIEPKLSPNDFIDILRRSTLAERRPVAASRYGEIPADRSVELGLAMQTPEPAAAMIDQVEESNQERRDLHVVTPA